MRVLGVDPGLTRCGIGAVDGTPGRPPSLVHADVIRTPAGLDIAARLLALEEEIDTWLAEYRPDAVAVERVFSQHNVRTVMGTAQAGAVAIVCAARPAGRAAHPQRGEGGGHRQRPGGQGPGHEHGDAAAPADGPATARGHRR